MTSIFHPVRRLLLTAPRRIATQRGVSFPSKVILSTIIAIATSVAQTPPPKGAAAVKPKTSTPTAKSAPAATTSPVAPVTPVPAPPAGLVPAESLIAPAPTAPVQPVVVAPQSALPLPTEPVAPAAPVVTPANSAEPMVQLKYLAADVRDVLAYYETLTGRRLIYSAQLVGQINLFITEQIVKSEAIKLIELSLAINGFYIVPTEDDKIWRATGVGSNPKSVGIPFIDREELLPLNEQVVMFLFKLEYADPTELATTLSTGVLVPNQAGFTSIVPLPKANALLVTENTAMIRTLIRVVKAIDVKPSEVVSEFLTLQRAQADEVVTNLEKLFEKKDQAAAAAGVVPGGAQGIQPGQNGRAARAAQAAANGENETVVEINGGNGTGPTEDNIIIGKVRLTADKRTNRIHIVTRPVNMKLIRALIKEYDADVKLPEPGIRPLRYRPVEEVIDAVVAAIKDPGEKDGGAGGSSAPGSATGQTPRAQTQSQNNRSTGNDRFGGNTGGAGGDSGGGAGTLNESLSTQERDGTPLAQQVGKSTIIADKRSNSIIVIGTPDVKEKVFSLLDKLDQRQSQVQIEVVVGELRLTENEQFGLEFILRNGGILPAATATGTGTGTTTAPNLVGYSDTGGSVLNLNSLLSSQTINKALAGGGGGISGIVAASNAFNATVKALESTNRFRVITKPHIFTTNGKKATITSGEEVPVPTNIQSQFNNTGTTGGIQSNSSIAYKKIALTLEVLPLVNSEREVSLDIVQNISERSGTTRIDNNDIPTIASRAIKTYVSVPNGGTLILGGLIKESLDNTRGGINKLVRIPIIGPLFGKTTKDKVRTELIVLMRPIVTMDPPETAGLREKTFQDFNIPPDFDQTIIPQGMRETIPKAKVIAQPRATAPVLREEPPATRRK